MYPDKCIIQDLESDRVVAVGQAKGRLYVLDERECKKVLGDHVTSMNAFKYTIDNKVYHAIPDENRVHYATNGTMYDEFQLWHNKLGHVSIDVLNHIIPHLTSKNQPSLPCDVCAQSKQQRMAFPISHSTTKSPFDLIHVDLWGPYKHKSITGAHYVLTIVDDFSRATWTFLITNKQLVPSTLKTYLTLIQTQHNKTVKTVRTDNGTEFMNKECQTFSLTRE